MPQQFQRNARCSTKCNAERGHLLNSAFSYTLHNGNKIEKPAEYVQDFESVCSECGATGYIHYGFMSPCRYNGGAHRPIRQIVKQIGA